MTVCSHRYESSHSYIIDYEDESYSDYDDGDLDFEMEEVAAPKQPPGTDFPF